jgi:hypothetical protein
MWLLALGTTVAAAASFQFGGRASGWAGASYDTAWLGQAGLRYLPEAQFAVPLGGELELDAVASVNGSVSAAARVANRPEVTARLRPYRASVRLSGARFEARAGLQKLSFGSAALLRPLAWFDRVDPRDPLELTDGVWGLLGRYYLPGNANLWAWGLIGNSSPKGWETFGTERWQPEFGGRAQVPVPRGEAGISLHRRSVAVVWAMSPLPRAETTAAAETRIGLDGRWDLGVGLWVEAVAGRTESEHMPYPWQRLVTVGVDYTLPVGSGLSVLTEHLYASNGVTALGRDADAHVTAVSLSLPLGILDNLRGMLYRDWERGGWYRYAGWQRTLDNWVLSLGAFWNPDRLPAGSVAAGAAGKGVRLDVVFNH